MYPDQANSEVLDLPRGWHSRGYLPHFDAGQAVPQFVTFRLADSLPMQVIDGWREELLSEPETEREAQLHRLIEAFLDAGRGSCYLRELRIANLVEGALLHFDAVRYAMHAWVVMPNHVHALFSPCSGWRVSAVVGAWKLFTSKAANKMLSRSGQFWQEDYFDRYVRNEHHFLRILDYIESNPVKASLCSQAEDWPVGNARFKLQKTATVSAPSHQESNS